MTNEPQQILEQLEVLRDRMKEEEDVLVASKRWNGPGGWWEIGGYRTVLDDAIKRIRAHRRRVEKPEAQRLEELVVLAKRVGATR